jgi:cell wall-associated NlpC family hydrolase
MRCLAAAGVCIALLSAPLPAAAGNASGSSGQSWARAEIKLVTTRGLFAGPAATFRPADPLTAGALAGAVAGLTGNPVDPPADPAEPVSIVGLDAALVGVLGLDGAAHEFGAGVRAAGLDPPGRFGTEAVARLIGLRFDHPAAHDGLELQPQQTATRAEAAFSVARTLALLSPPASPSRYFGANPNGAVGLVQGWADSFSLPQLGDWQRQVLQTAVSLIGYPYVWGGEDEKVTAGFDCSGFVWRVYKLASYPGAPTLGSTILGRTAAQMAAEVPKRERIGLHALDPGDVLFFGDGPKSKPADIGHTSIYLGNGWVIQSSGQGVSLSPLGSWYTSTFAWARRPLVEAGLEAPVGPNIAAAPRA